MAIAETDIENTALIMLGERPIAAGAQTSAAGTAAVTLYPIMRDSLLREFPWTFALKWAQLNQLAGAPIQFQFLPNNEGPGTILYTAAYQLPNDLIRVRRFSPESAHWRLVGTTLYTDAVPAQVNLTLNGLQPLNADGADNQPPLTTAPQPVAPTGIEYVSRVTDANLFDGLFRDVLATKLAAEIAFAVTGLADQQQIMAQRLEKKLQEASSVNGIEQWPDQLYDNIVGNVRYGYSGSSGLGF